MKRKNTPNKSTRVAILTTPFNSESYHDDWKQLLPAGKFKARDGRPFDTEDGYWFLDEAIANDFIAQTIAESKGQKILIDYDHQTLRRAETGEKALAAGWIIDPATDIRWQADGIYIRPKWTPVTQVEVDANQWGALSAVFPYDAQGRPLYLRMAAVTNDPALPELKSLAALAAQLFTPTTPKETNNMNELLKVLLMMLGVISTDDEFSDEHLDEYKDKAVSALDALKAASAAAAEIKDAVDADAPSADIVETSKDAIQAVDPQIDEAANVIKQAELNGTLAALLKNFVPVSIHQKALQNQAALSASNHNHELARLIQDARAKGQIVASEEDGLYKIGQTQGVAVLSSIIATRSPIAALNVRQTATVTTKTAINSVAELNASDLAVIKATGISKDDYLNTKKGLINGN